MRIYKYVQAIRLFKTRSLAAKACLSEKAKINGDFVKLEKRANILFLSKLTLSDLDRIQTCNRLSRNQVFYSVELRGQSFTNVELFNQEFKT